MDLLQQARAEIDTVDAEMAALFERRMRAVADVVRYKAETGKPVFDAAREAAVLDKNTARITDEALRPYYRAFLSDAMSISRAYQRARLGRDTAAYQGVPGAWSHIALRRLFPFARETACTTWGEVFDAVQNGDAQFGVLPFENSNAGDVSTVLDLLYTHPDIIIARMCDLPIRQDLLGVPGATLETVRICWRCRVQRCRPSARSSATRRRWPRAAFLYSSTALKRPPGATPPTRPVMWPS